LRKFDDSAAACNEKWSKQCVGPSRATYATRLGRSAARERSAFLQSYNARLLNGLLITSIAGIIIFRFLIKASLLELGSWQGGVENKLSTHVESAPPPPHPPPRVCMRIRPYGQLCSDIGSSACSQ